MHRRLVSTLSALVLAWLAGPATAAEPVPYGPTGFAADRAPAAKPVSRADIMPVVAAPEVLAMPKHDQAPPQLQGPYVPVWEPGHNPDCDKKSGKLLIGGGVMYLQPHFESNPAYFVTSFDATLGGGGAILLNNAASNRQEDFRWDYEWAPRAWVGFTDDCGFGVRGNWFYFHHGAQADASLAAENLGFTPAGAVIGSNAAIITIPDPLGVNATVLFNGIFVGNVNAPGVILGGAGLANPFAGVDQLAFESDLQMQVYDLEAIQEISNGPWAILLGGGVRYAHISQAYNALRFNSDAFDIGAAGLTVILEDFAVVQSGHNFDGIGPTVSAEVRRTLGQGGLALYGNARGSMLFGSGRHNANAAATLIVRTDPAIPGAGPNGEIIREDSFASAQTSRDDVMPVIELEVGAQFGRNLGNNRLILGAGLVSQTWFGAGNASSENGNLGLFGLSLSAGLSY